MTSFQTTANVGKTQDKYCLLSFMHRNRIGILTPFAKINKRECLNKVREGGEKILKLISDPPLKLSTRE